MKRNKGRRNFIKNIIGTGAGLMILPNWVIGKSQSPNGKMNVAFVGIGGRGKSACDNLIPYEKVNAVCFCDVSESDRTAKARAKYPNVPFYKDYRVMFDKQNKEIDAVVISTPDHAHYPIALWTLGLDKHMYLEKPLARTIAEVREIAKIAASKKNIVTQMGNQGMSQNGWRQIKDWYQAGVFGEVQDMWCWSDRPWWPSYSTWPTAEPVPSGLDWNLWLNVAPPRDFSKKIAPNLWRPFFDYSIGALGDHCCHAFVGYYFGLDLGMPVKIRTDCKNTPICYAEKSVTTYEFAPKGNRPAVKLHWYDGNQKPFGLIRGVSDDDLKSRDLTNSGAIVGTKETVMLRNIWNPIPLIWPREKMKEMVKNGAAFPKSDFVSPKKNHWVLWADACLGEGKCDSDIPSRAAKLTEFVLLGAVASFFPGQTLEYDAESGGITNVKEANKLFNSQYEYRKEFLPGKII